MTTEKVHEAIGKIINKAIDEDKKASSKPIGSMLKHEGIAEGLRMAADILTAAQLEADAELSAKYEGTGL